MEKKIIQVDEKVTCKDADPLESSAYVCHVRSIGAGTVSVWNQSGDRASDERCRHTGLYRCNKRKSTGVLGFQFCISGSGWAGH